MFKDEAGRLQVVEFVGLRAKLYAYSMDIKERSPKSARASRSMSWRMISHFRISKTPLSIRSLK